MSVTTTDNARIITLRHTLADYELHHSQPAEEDAAPAPAPNQQPSRTPGNPPDWETEWRRVPLYRPVVDPVDEQRNSYQNAIEQNFVRVMFGGVYLMASASWLWRKTGGQLNRSYFSYKVGGEW